MDTMTFFKAFILILCLWTVEGRSSGAQTPQACTDMTPGHGGASQQSTAAPYRIVLSNNTYYGGDRIRVTLENTDASTFKGYFVQARNSDRTTIPGFDITGESNAQFRTCFSANDAVTHTNASDKNGVSFDFIAPSTSQGNLTIYATVVQNFTTFWVMIPSEQIIDMAPAGSSSASTNVPSVLAVFFTIICVLLCMR